MIRRQKIIDIISPVSLISIVVVLLILMQPVCPRYYDSEFTINSFRRNKGWMFLDRMSFDEGIAEFEFELTLVSTKAPAKEIFQLSLLLIPENEWAETDLARCENRLPGFTEQKGQQARQTLQIQSYPITLRNQTKFTFKIKQRLIFKNTVTIHFVLTDCDKNLIDDTYRKETSLKFVLEMKNGELHHGSDEKLYGKVLPFLLVLTVIMSYYAWPSNKQLFEENEKDWAKIILTIALGFNLAALLIHYLGYMIYVYGEGRQYGFFDFSYLLFHCLSEVLLTCLIIFVSYGWTITFIADAEFDLYVPLISMLGLINLILTLLGKINDGQSDKYHMYDTIPSYLLVFFRIVTVCIMLIGIIKTYNENKDNRYIRSFLVRFSLLGSTFFLSLPLIMIIATFLPYEQRKIAVFIAVELIKNFVNVALTWMVSSKKSHYRKIKADAGSFMEKDNKLL